MMPFAEPRRPGVATEVMVCEDEDSTQLALDFVRANPLSWGTIVDLEGANLSYEVKNEIQESHTRLWGLARRSERLNNSERKSSRPYRNYDIIPKGCTLEGSTISTWGRTLAVSNFFGQGLVVDLWRCEKLPDCIRNYFRDPHQLKFFWARQNDINMIANFDKEFRLESPSLRMRGTVDAQPLLGQYFRQSYPKLREMSYRSPHPDPHDRTLYLPSGQGAPLAVTPMLADTPGIGKTAFLMYRIDLTYQKQHIRPRGDRLICSLEKLQKGGVSQYQNFIQYAVSDCVFVGDFVLTRLQQKLDSEGRWTNSEFENLSRLVDELLQILAVERVRPESVLWRAEST